MFSKLSSEAWAAVTVALVVLLITAQHFPYDSDAPLSSHEIEKARQYYAEAYRSAAPDQEQAPSEYETKYLAVAAQAAKDFDIEGRVRRFSEEYRLQDRAVLDVGSGRGYLQDVVENYTGLDISPTVARFYHKKFVLGSATAMPFPDDSFDGAWSIWVLEHVPNPEQALLEIRRVMRDGGVIYFNPAWGCTPWAADGYEVRPYSDFGLMSKLVKASIPIRSSAFFVTAEAVFTRSLRKAAFRMGGPTKFHYRKIEPNYKEYWQPDSDAVNSLDRYEAMIWFLSRGDECLNCDGDSGSVLMSPLPLVIRVHKRSVK